MSGKDQRQMMNSKEKTSSRSYLLKQKGNIKNTLKPTQTNRLIYHANKIVANALKGNEIHLKPNGKNINYTDTVAQGSSQVEIPIKYVKYGMYATTDNKYLSVVEILPINFLKKSIAQRDRIISNYETLFKVKNKRYGFKILSDFANSNELISNIKEHAKKQTNPIIRDSLNDYIEFIKELGNSKTVAKRYFYIFQYEGEERDPKLIAKSLREKRLQVISIMRSCGNDCLIHENEDRFIYEFFYYYFNRLTYQTESFDERCNRIKNDYDIYNKLTKGKKKYPTATDLFAPKGLYFINRDAVYMDGLYYTYLGLTSESWPFGYTDPLWISNFDFGPDVDIDIIANTLNQRLTSIALKELNRNSRSKLTSKRLSDEKKNKTNEKYQNNKLIYDQLKSGSTLLDVAIIMTIRSTDLNNLLDRKKYIIDTLELIEVELDESYLCAEDYFKMVMPCLYITKPFYRLAHNVLSDAMASTYYFINYELNHPKGFLLGTTEDNAIATIDNFNTTLYKNANIFIIGTSGAGKTFTAQLVGGRMFLNGIRCFFIIPKKGWEYKPGCEDHGGLFIPFGPGFTARINPMEIRPESTLNTKIVNDDAFVDKGSYLSKKTNFLIVWLQLHMKDTELSNVEIALLKKCITRTYNNFGITNDNNSIYENLETKKLKRFPYLSDLKTETEKEPELRAISLLLEDYVTGSCSNMNGDTNIDLNNPYIVFDIDEDVIGESLLPPFLYLVYDHIYSVVKESPISKDAIFMDEIWKMLQSEACAKQVQNMVKVIRGYGGCTVISTQEIEDFMNAPLGLGRTIINNSEITIMLAMKEQSLKKVREIYKITDDEFERIIGYPRGQGMLISNGEKVELNIQSSPKEKASYSVSDVNERIAQAEKRK